MDVNRSGYYKWRKRKGKPNKFEQDRILLTQLLEIEHKKYPSHGYHRLADDVFAETGWIFSHNLAHKAVRLPAFIPKQENTDIGNREKKT